MSETDDDERLDRIQDQIAEINSNAANAVTASAAIQSHPAPETTLRRVQMSLIDLYTETARALDSVEHYLDDYDSGWETPRQIVHEHAERLKEQYNGPVLNIALMLLENNRREWLHRKEGTNGANGVRRHGLTENQRTWLNELQDHIPSEQNSELRGSTE